MILLTCWDLDAARWARVRSEAAIVYADIQAQVAIGYLKTGTKIRVGDVVQGRKRTVATVVSGKVAYIKEEDLLFSKDKEMILSKLEKARNPDRTIYEKLPIRFSLGGLAQTFYYSQEVPRDLPLLTGLRFGLKFSSLTHTYEVYYSSTSGTDANDFEHKMDLLSIGLYRTNGVRKFLGLNYDLFLLWSPNYLITQNSLQDEAMMLGLETRFTYEQKITSRWSATWALHGQVLKSFINQEDTQHQVTRDMNQTLILGLESSLLIHYRFF